MNDIVSVFSGIKPTPIAETDWMTVLRNIQSDKYRDVITSARQITDPVQYREFKKKLPAVTFCANFTKNRDRQNVLAPTGFLIPDLDHLENVDDVFQTLSQDENIWFIFRSPSGSGLKCAVRAEGIKTDDDIKKLYAASERYFSETYNLKLDPACKDISRLTFVSHDPDLWINPNPFYFNIQQWMKPAEQKFYSPPEQNNGWKAKYGNKVLESCCNEISRSSAGNQHNTRLRMARLVGGYVASGFIEEAAALSALEQAVIASGAKLVHQAMDTIQDGLSHGKQRPLQPEEREPIRKKDDIQYYCDTNESFGHEDIDDIEDIEDSRGHMRTPWGHLEDSLRTVEDSPVSNQSQKKVYNLASEIKKWIKESSGCFTCEQIDREFGLISRQDKKNRSYILARMCAHDKTKKQIIKKDKSVPGKYQIIDHSLDIMDILNTDVDSFAITLPFDLHRYCEIPKKGIIMIAGSSDSGKTTLILNILKANLKKQFQTLYLASEMGPNETKKRLLKFDDIRLVDWLSAKFISRSNDQGSVIEAHNPDGLTLIDYLEEKEGEYYKITSQIREIYDAIGDGVAVIGIQKHTESEYGRGGQGTIEKARLSISLDKIGLVGDDLVSAVKVIKIKNWIRKNLFYHELHFKIKHGSEIEALSDWMPCSQVNRKLCLAQYQQIDTAKNPERKKEQVENWVYTFKAKTGKLVGINEETFENWQKTYSKLNLYDVLERIANSTYQRQWLNEKGWIFQITGMLAKENDK